MKKLFRSKMIAAASVASMLAVAQGKPESPRQKKPRSSAKDHAKQDRVASHRSNGSAPQPQPKESAPKGDFPAAALGVCTPVETDEAAGAVVVADRYPWKRDIVTTTFWIGEKPARNNPVPNRTSAWDKAWAAHYGGTDTPDRAERRNFRPADFLPGQNPFYVALPYNDLQMDGHKPEAEKLVPWFREEYSGPGKSVCKGRWIAIRYKDRTVYAQWEDAGPFRTDHGSYVFGNDRPKKNINKGAGLDVSPAVRDYLGMSDTDVTDWKFVDFDEVPHGPWAEIGENNTFVIHRRLADAVRLAAIAAGRIVAE